MATLIRIVGEISETSFAEFSAKLSICERSRTPVKIELYSEGGNPTAALAFASRIRLAKVKVTVLAIGEVSSSAVLILAAGHKRKMAEEAWVMVHETTDELKGDVIMLEKLVAQRRREEDQWAELLGQWTTSHKYVWTALHKETTYLTATQCLAMGLIDEII